MGLRKSNTNKKLSVNLHQNPLISVDKGTFGMLA
jgi:hypothetical protein